MTDAPPPRSDSFQAWYQAALPADGSLLHRPAGVTGASLLLGRHPRVLPSPPSADCVVEVNVGSPIRGRFDFGYGRFEAGVPTGSFVVLAAGRPIEIESPARDIHLLSVAVPADLLAARFSEGGVFEGELLHRRVHSDPLACQLLQRLWAEAAANGIGGGLLAECLLDCLTALLVMRAEPRGLWPPPPASRLCPRQLAAVAEYIDAHLPWAISLDDLAGVTRVSRFHFARLFRAATGLPPHQYLIERRVERAKMLITAGRMTLAQVAADVGFADQAHLTRHFKSLVGCTPGQFT